MMTVLQQIAYALKKAQGFGNVKSRRLLSYADCTDRSSFLTSARNLVSEKDYEAISDAFLSVDFAKTEKELEDRGIRLIAYGEENYPESLMPYEDMPILLYCKGDISLLSYPSIAVVGTRFPSSYGKKATEEFVKKLTEYYCIVSGLARGIDACAHKAALENNGKTVAVLGCGVDVIYPSGNYELYNEIEKKGLLISEYEPDDKADAYNFPSRNRIISGLSGGVLVAEAGEKSGTMHTVKCAEKQGKPVYCVPGSIFSKTSDGCNSLIRDGKAMAVTSAVDVLNDRGVEIKKENVGSVPMDEDVQMVYGILRERGESHFDELADETGLSIPKLSAALIKGEAIGLFTKTKSNFWSVY